MWVKISREGAGLQLMGKCRRNHIFAKIKELYFYG